MGLSPPISDIGTQAFSLLWLHYLKSDSHCHSVGKSPCQEHTERKPNHLALARDGGEAPPIPEPPSPRQKRGHKPHLSPPLGAARRFRQPSQTPQTPQPRLPLPYFLSWGLHGPQGAGG